jgi:hypothetical protein
MLPPHQQKPEVGAVLLCDFKYTSSMLDRFEFAGACLATAWIAHFTRTAATFPLAEVYTVRALDARRWRDARTIASLALKGQSPDHLHHTLRVNLWMARRELGESSAVLESEIAAWVPPPEEPQYLAAKAALTRDEAATIDALRECESVGDVRPADMKDWPLFVDMASRSAAVARIVRQRPGAIASPRRSTPRKTRRQSRK